MQFALRRLTTKITNLFSFSHIIFVYFYLLFTITGGIEPLIFRGQAGWGNHTGITRKVKAHRAGPDGETTPGLPAR